MGAAARLSVSGRRPVAVGAANTEGEADGVPVGGASWLRVSALTDSEPVALRSSDADGVAADEAVFGDVTLPLLMRLRDVVRFCVGDAADMGAVAETLRLFDTDADIASVAVGLREAIGDTVAVPEVDRSAVSVFIAVALFVGVAAVGPAVLLTLLEALGDGEDTSVVDAVRCVVADEENEIVSEAVTDRPSVRLRVSRVVTVAASVRVSLAASDRDALTASDAVSLAVAVRVSVIVVDWLRLADVERVVDVVPPQCSIGAAPTAASAAS